VRCSSCLVSFGHADVKGTENLLPYSVAEIHFYLPICIIKELVQTDSGMSIAGYGVIK